MRTLVRDDFLASKWDRSPSSLDAAVRASLPHADTVGLAEVAAAHRRAVLDYEGWTTLQDTVPKWMGEVALLVRDDTWKVLHWHAEELAPDMGPGGPVVGLFAVLEHVETGARIVRSVAHLMSAVEGSWRDRTRRVIVAARAIQRQRRIVRGLYAKYRADAVLVTNDWNLNLIRRPWVRAMIRAAWPGLRPPPPARTPDNGDHPATAKKRRLTVWPIARHLPGYSFEVLPASPASDHRGIRTRGYIPTPKRSHRR